MDVFSWKQNINLVLELCSTDLEVMIRNRELTFKPADTKSILLMALKGIEYLHRLWILHRDVKPNNLFITEGGVVKLGDFGRYLVEIE